jgi:aryl-alcohol dehydrogenase-like predicted oxidoreductase
MDKRQLGQTALHISPLGLGTVKFGRNQGVKYPHGFELPSEEELAALLSLAQSLGINTLDTAPAYGLSEERLGRLLADQRDDWIIIGKAGEEFDSTKDGGESSYHFTPDHFEMSLERSLKRLNTNYIDALLIHSDGNDVEILQNDALIRKLHDFKDQGLIKAHGASTKTVDGGKMALDLLDIVMATYNPIYTDEKPVLDYAAELGKGVLLKKALSSGHVDKLGGADPVQHAMDFAFAHPGVTGMIVGTINPAHMKHNAACATAALKKLT